MNITVEDLFSFSDYLIKNCKDNNFNNSLLSSDFINKYYYSNLRNDILKYFEKYNDSLVFFLNSSQFNYYPNKW